ncbi:MAG: tetraacyldisaccharide 4'-kinase, partial [Rickettsiales bacterium]|nr:tetraacyldisaccharide 4'-kinase [Rickettsiales bacterium]
MLKILQFFLVPVGFIYNTIVQIRLKLIKPYKAKVPVICIGNISLGGTGKTPFVQYLTKYFKSKKLKPAILSRGYKGKLEYIKVNPSKHSASNVGDEPLMLANSAPVYIGKNRAKTAQMAIKDGANILLMDDGFQNPTLHKDISFVVVDGKKWFGNHQVFPAGPLREYLSCAKKRASAFVVINSYKKVKGAKTVNVSVKTNFKADKTKKYFAFGGIGNPQKFFDTLKESGAK